MDESNIRALDTDRMHRGSLNSGILKAQVETKAFLLYSMKEGQRRKDISCPGLISTISSTPYTYPQSTDCRPRQETSFKPISIPHFDLHKFLRRRTRLQLCHRTS